MADLQSLDLALEEALSSLSGLGLSLELRSEQKQAVMTLLSSRDLLAVLPTGFGKSLIFQLLVHFYLLSKWRPKRSLNKRSFRKKRLLCTLPYVK